MTTFNSSNKFSKTKTHHLTFHIWKMRVEEKDHSVPRFDTGRKWSYPTSQWASSDHNHILLYTHTLEEPVHTLHPCFLGNLFRGSGYAAAF